MSDDVQADARRLLQGITPAPWVNRDREWYDHDRGFPEDVEVIQGTDPDANPYVDIAEVKPQRWDVEDDVEMWANAEFIAAAPQLVQGLLAKLDEVRARIKLAESWTRHLVPEHDGAVIDALNVDTLLDDLARMVGDQP